MKSKLQIKDVVEMTGVDRETLRFYEQKGLLPEPTRTAAGYRQYNPDVVPRLRFIKLAQNVGFTLREILDLLKMGQDRSLTTQELQAIADAQIKVLDERIQNLQTMRSLLRDLSARASNIHTSSTCPVRSQFQILEK